MERRDSRKGQAGERMEQVGGQVPQLPGRGLARMVAIDSGPLCTSPSLAL